MQEVVWQLKHRFGRFSRPSRNRCCISNDFATSHACINTRALMHACDATCYEENHKVVQIIKIFIKTAILLAILSQNLDGGKGNRPCIDSHPEMEVCSPTKHLLVDFCTIARWPVCFPGAHRFMFIVVKRANNSRHRDWTVDSDDLCVSPSSAASLCALGLEGELCSSQAGRLRRGHSAGRVWPSCWR